MKNVYKKHNQKFPKYALSAPKSQNPWASSSVSCEIAFNLPKKINNLFYSNIYLHIFLFVHSFAIVAFAELKNMLRFILN